MEQFRTYLDFIWVMTEKEIKARYKRAIFGFLWVILNPILQMLVIGVIFSIFIKIPNYFLFLFTGLLPWTFVSMSLSKATPSIVFERLLLEKARFPIEAIPVSIIISNLIHTFVSFTLLICYLVVINNKLTFEILLVIPTMIWLSIVTLGASLFTSALQVRFRDINFFVQTLLILLFYATPILYSLDVIPKTYYLLFAFNPLTSIFELFHYSILKRGVLDSGIFLINILLTFVILSVGILVFRKGRRYFVDWL